MNTEFAKTLDKTLSEYLSFYSEFLDFEKSKLEAVENNRLELLDGLVKKEEAYLLKSRGMEHNRINSQAENGYEGKTLRELIDVAPEDKKEDFLSTFTALNDTVNELQRTSERCNVAIKARLQAIERAMNNIKSDEAQKTYDDSANSRKSGGTFFSSKV